MGEDFELKLQAIEALGNNGCDEAVPFLQQLKNTRSLVWAKKAREIREKAESAIEMITKKVALQPEESEVDDEQVE